MATDFELDMDLARSVQVEYYRVPKKEPDPEVWAAAPFDVKPPAHPEHGDKSTYTLTLDEDLIQALLNSSTPLYNSSPRHLINNRRLAMDGTPPRSAIADVKPIRKKIGPEFFEPLCRMLRDHAGFGKAQASWQAAQPPNAGEKWDSAEAFCKSLRHGLFGALGALLEFFPEDQEIAIADGGDQDRFCICITAVTPLTAAQKSKDQTTQREVIMVIELMPWLLAWDIKDMVKTAGPPSAGPYPDLYFEQRDSAEARYTALQRLAHRMRATNAPLGCIYNGSDLVVFERDFNHDKLQWKQLSEEGDVELRGTKRPASTADSPQSVPQARSESTAADKTLDYQDACLTLQLRPWSTVFSHPLRPYDRFSQARNDNIATCLAALAQHAYARFIARPKALGGSKRQDTIHRYLLKKGRCTCSPPTGTDSAPQASGPLPTGFVGLLRRLHTANPDPPNASPSGATVPAAGIHTGEETLIAIGELTCSPRFPMPYLLVCSPTDVCTGTYTVAHHGTIYVVTTEEVTAAAQAALAATNVFAEVGEDGGIEDDANMRGNHLYRADQKIAAELLTALESACPARSILKQDIIVKLPNLVEHSADSKPLAWTETGSSQQSPSTSMRSDRLVCVCSSGICETLCANCDKDGHEHELASFERQVEKIVTALQIENGALSTLTEPPDMDEDDLPHLFSMLTYGHLVSLQLAFSKSKQSLCKALPALDVLLDRSWHVHLDAGIALADVVEFANAKATSPSTLNELSWSPRRFQAASKLFDTIIANSRAIELIVCSAERQLKALWDVALNFRDADSTKVYLAFYSLRAFELFARQPLVGLDQDPTDGGEKTTALPLARLVSLSGCAYLGFLSELKMVDESRSEGEEYWPLSPREELFLSEDEEDDPDLPWMDHSIRYDIGDFIRTWIRPPRRGGHFPTAAPSAAPSADSTFTSRELGPNLPGAATF